MPNSQFQNSETRNSGLPEEFEILRSAPTKDYDDILFLSSIICKVPAAALLILTEEGFSVKAAHAMSAGDLHLSQDLIDLVLKSRKVIVLSDLEEQQKKKWEANGFSFCAACPLITENGAELGLLLVFGSEEQHLHADQEKAFSILGNQVLNLVEYRKQNNEILRVQHKLEEKYAELDKFASVVSHDLKSPLANIISLTELLKEENNDDFSGEGKQYLDYLSQASQSLRSYIDGLLIFYRSERILEKEEEDVDLEKFFGEITNLYSVKPDVQISYPREGKLEKVNKAALTQIFMNLISNALKYNNKETRKVNIHFETTPAHYIFQVEDNGNGIPQEAFSRIFDLFTTLDQNDREGNPGSGIGLATVKKLLDHMNGQIEIESEPGKGSNFKFKIKRSC